MSTEKQTSEFEIGDSVVVGNKHSYWDDNPSIWSDGRVTDIAGPLLQIDLQCSFLGIRFVRRKWIKPDKHTHIHRKSRAEELIAKYQP